MDVLRIVSSGGLDISVVEPSYFATTELVIQYEVFNRLS
jgi:hypothetical protein